MFLTELYPLALHCSASLIKGTESSEQAPASPESNLIFYVGRLFLFLAYVTLDAGCKPNLETAPASNAAAATC
jgi:hypothetical protein